MATLTADGLRILITSVAIIGGGKLLDSEEAPATRQDIAELRLEVVGDLRDHEHRIAALEREP